ncbi:hypothetical protein Hdeb2414_s0020g00566071 [Helianthus debilis subsp. tardiflorus]
MGSCHHASDYCLQNIWPALNALYRNSSLPDTHVNLTNLDANSLDNFCRDVNTCESNLLDSEFNSEIEGEYSSPMVLIGIYISIASLFCILAMALDLLNSFRIRKFWFPTKYFSLNAASITVIAVAMKLPVDLTSPMPGWIDQFGKLGSLAFMCTMMSNLMPSLASMDNKSLLANITALSILVITIRTQVIGPYPDYVGVDIPSMLLVLVACIYLVMLLFLLIILISSSITLPTTKKILEIKYQAISKNILIHQHQQENLISTVENLRQFVKRYWIMAETGNPQFVMVSNPLSSASGIICGSSMLIYMFFMFLSLKDYPHFPRSRSVYKWSMNAMVVTQSIGVVAGSIAPLLRCFTVLSFKSFAKQNRNYFFVFKVEKYWTQKLSEWKESRISFLSSGRRYRALLHNSKKFILSFCIGFQKVVVVSCKIIGLLPIVVVIPFVYFSRCFNSVKRMLFNTSTASSNVETNEDLSKYVLLVEDNTQLAKRTMKRISESMNQLIQKAERKQHNNLLKLLEEYVGESAALNGVVTFDNDQFQSPLPVEHVNSWSLPIISLTCIAVFILDIRQARVDNLFKSVGEGLLYTHLVEETLNRESVYVNIRRATVTLWHEVEETCKWLETPLERSDYEEKNSKIPKDVIRLGSACKEKNSRDPRDIINLFAQSAEKILNEFNKSTNGEMEKENLPRKVIAANSMYRIAKTILHTYESNDLDIVEDELFTRLSGMIADIIVACLTNIPRAIAMRCHESAIEKRGASVAAAIDLLGRTTKIIEKLERHVPNMDQDKMAHIDEWRIHLRQP